MSTQGRYGVLRVSAAEAGAPLDSSAVIATGKYLFPFRTEKSSPLAPMVLGAHAPGRVGCRRFIRWGNPWFPHQPPPLRWCTNGRHLASRPAKPASGHDRYCTGDRRESRTAVRSTQAFRSAFGIERPDQGRSAGMRRSRRIPSSSKTTVKSPRARKVARARSNLMGASIASR